MRIRIVQDKLFANVILAGLVQLVMQKLIAHKTVLVNTMGFVIMMPLVLVMLDLGNFFQI